MALHQCIHEVISALNVLRDQNENIDARGQLRGMFQAIHPFLCFSLFNPWNELMRGSHDVQKYLQRKRLPQEICAHKMKTQTF